MATYEHCYLVEGIGVQSVSPHMSCSEGNPRSRYLRSDDGGVFDVALPWGVIVLGAAVGWR
jgi:hypothetical protein